MAISPLESHDNRVSLRPGKLTDNLLLVTRIDRLLQLLDRRDIPPQQRVRLLNTLNALQQQQTMLQSMEEQAPSLNSSGKRESVLVTGNQVAEQVSTRVNLGEIGKALLQQNEMEKALEVKSGLERTLGTFGRSIPETKAETLRTAAENYQVMAMQTPTPGEGQMKPYTLQVIEPRPIFGLIPPQWLQQGTSLSKKLINSELGPLFVVMVLILAALFFL